jgi:hypothetical protein
MFNINFASLNEGKVSEVQVLVWLHCENLVQKLGELIFNPKINVNFLITFTMKVKIIILFSMCLTFESQFVKEVFHR